MLDALYPLLALLELDGEIVTPEDKVRAREGLGCDESEGRPREGLGLEKG